MSPTIVKSKQNSFSSSRGKILASILLKAAPEQVTALPIQENLSVGDIDTQPAILVGFENSKFCALAFASN